MPNRIVHFEIQADDPQRAIVFYQTVFGWEFPKWLDEPPYWGVMTATQESKEPGINGGLLPRPAKTPGLGFGTNAFVCTVQVENFDEIAAKIEKAGGKVALPKQAIMGIAWQGYFLDTEGNTFGIHQPDKNAK
ncbi:VOC family protein [Candidatus Parcubacteria bacterium]|jgi:predicted enzyme related to lactoylglutathione lyase|nr:MAG: VOC family protein [Candidatus Parcubacteria bacterium]